MTRHAIHKSDSPQGVRWHARVELEPDPLTGQRRQRRLSAETRRALDALIAETITRRDDGRVIVDAAVPLREYLAQWLDTVAPTVKPGTLRTWTSRCDAWLIPVLGHVKLKDLTPLHIERLMQRMLAEGRSPSHANVMHATLRTALSAAVKWELISRNPASAVTPPRTNAPEMQTWTADEARRAIAATAEDRQYGALIRLALTTGMRMGELLGLRWQDVDTERGTLAVRQTVARGVKGRPTFGTPKTAKSRRSITIHADDLAALKKHRAWQLETRLAASSWAGHDLVFPDRHGEPIHPNSLAHRFEQLIKETGLPRIRFHDLRHTSISLMLLRGINAKIVAERVGHASIQITLDRYSHLMPGMQEDAAAQVADLLAAND